MAHVHAYGDVCPKARPIIHLGATSCYVTDNTDLILLARGAGAGPRPAGRRDRRPGPLRPAVSGPALPGLHALSAGPADDGGQAGLPLGLRLRARPGRDRVPPGEPQGPRARRARPARRPASWRCSTAITRRSAGWTSSICRKIGFAESYAVTGQTYPRKIDSQVLAVLSGISQSAHKMATDLRLLAHRKEIEEPFEQGADRLVGDGLQAEPHALRADLLAGPLRDEPGEQRRGRRRPCNGWNGRWTTAPTGGWSCRRRSWPPTPC